MSHFSGSDFAILIFCDIFIILDMFDGCCKASVLISVKRDVLKIQNCKFQPPNAI